MHVHTSGDQYPASQFVGAAAGLVQDWSTGQSTQSASVSALYSPAAHDTGACEVLAHDIPAGQGAQAKTWKKQLSKRKMKGESSIQKYSLLSK